MNNKKNIGVILVGGSGSRLWPVSRKDFPKQFTRLFGSDSLIQTTVKRLSGIFGDDLVFIVGEQYRELMNIHLDEINFTKKRNIISEPTSRNTAPAIYLGLKKITENYGDTNIFVFPADHIIKDEKRFAAILKEAEKHVTNGYIVTFGIKPSYPETGYGYIERGEQVDGITSYVKDFVEKPDMKTAIEYLEEGNYLWNSGMFAFRASVMIKEYHKYMPGIPETMDKYLKIANDGGSNIYNTLPDISIDYAVMEKTDKCTVMECDIEWSDLGSWKSVYDQSGKDDSANVLRGNVLESNVERSLVIGGDELIVLNDLSDIVVVNTGDAILVSSLKKVNDIKPLISRNENLKQFVQSKKVNRPWGFFETLFSSTGYIAKKIVVNPCSRLSLEKHELRDESWTVASGVATVTIEGKQQVLSSGESIFIPRKKVHGLENTGNKDLVIIELQLGQSLDESDIVSLEDDYGRVDRNG